MAPQRGAWNIEANEIAADSFLDERADRQRVVAVAKEPWAKAVRLDVNYLVLITFNTPSYLTTLFPCVSYVDIVRLPQRNEHGMYTQSRKVNGQQHSPTIW